MSIAGVSIGVDSTASVAFGTSTVGAGAAGSLEATVSEVVLMKLRVCFGALCCGWVGARIQPSSYPEVLVVDVDSSLVGAVVSVVVAAAVDSVAGEAVTGVLTSGMDGIVGIVPTESSYTGSSASGFGCRGAGRVVYAFVTTGTVVVAGAYEDDPGELTAGAELLGWATRTSGGGVWA